MTIFSRICTSLILLTSMICSPGASAEQMQRLGDHEVHYIILPTTFLRPEIAAQYDIPRGKDRALVNVSVLNAEGQPVTAALTGQSRNLLGQGQQLAFREVREQDAIYYLALLSHSDEEHHRVRLEVILDDGTRTEINVSQKMYWKH